MRNHRPSWDGDFFVKSVKNLEMSKKCCIFVPRKENEL